MGVLHTQFHVHVCNSIILILIRPVRFEIGCAGFGYNLNIKTLQVSAIVLPIGLHISASEPGCAGSVKTCQV